MVENLNIDFLIEKAKSVLKNSYAPYSGIHVAAAILTRNGNVFLGVNVENASYGLTICAERSAISAMITAGEREPVAVAIVTDLDKPIPPCGACRQVIAEFNPETTIIMHSVKTGKTIIRNLKELFPNPFSLERK
ncbi:cytidine deaminase [Staphylothermus hellenicus]|uniref:cytidine deaminase n=1 Tax=Staphylothermus hellenicus (strain DSM 12710 / JCM 10830 / BK20S6-10-b1 / P8) TaxID=591019 RepID=D7DCG6_STAHD|nr:cytidine deaminase [Staphylothermus hellenicus]ADI31863.1 cytidine deaminase [Staphylothermus hellenicus DSM 12710]